MWSFYAAYCTGFFEPLKFIVDRNGTFLHKSRMSESFSSEKSGPRWCLESTADGGKSLARVPIQKLPFRIGRLDELELTLPFPSVSKRHAVLHIAEDGLYLRDLSSTNGTFVNRKRVKEAMLDEGDILHFAQVEFRIGRHVGGATRRNSKDEGTLTLRRIDLPQQFIAGTRELNRLLEQEMVTAVFQPIVSLPAGEILAYEVLGRGTHEKLPSNPKNLFRVAETMERESELSQLFRKNAATIVSDIKVHLPPLFFNTHPSELGTPELVSSLRELREILPDRELALEIHEGALAEPEIIAELKTHLDELDIRLALDDFGLGERFLQLAEVPPDYLKFDISYVRGLVDATVAKRRLLSMLMAAARELGAQPIAEGVETELEAGACTMMGFTLAQGFLYGEPVPFTQPDGRDGGAFEQPPEKFREHHQHAR